MVNMTAAVKICLLTFPNMCNNRVLCDDKLGMKEMVFYTLQDCSNCYVP